MKATRNSHEKHFSELETKNLVRPPPATQKGETDRIGYSIVTLKKRRNSRILVTYATSDEIHASRKPLERMDLKPEFFCFKNVAL